MHVDYNGINGEYAISFKYLFFADFDKLPFDFHFVGLGLIFWNNRDLAIGRYQL